jgi:transcriptional regulator with XRE-family HTH domain
MQKIGYRLRKARWLMKLSISQLSKQSGLDKKSIINIELNDTNCRIDTLWKICESSGISADYLLGFSKDKFINNADSI